MGFVIGLLWVLLILTMLLLMGVILLQEGKGGGLAEAFGGAGAETFGVKATGINRFTAILGGLFLVLSILINVCMRWREDAPVAAPLQLPPAVEGVQTPGAAGTPPGEVPPTDATPPGQTPK